MIGEPFREVPPVVLYPGQQTIPETQKIIEGDIIGFLAAPKGAYFPGFTLSSGLAGAIYGLLLYHNCWEKRVKENPVLAGENKGLILRIIIAHLIKTITISLCLNCTGLSVFYGMPFMAVFTASLPKELINFPVEVFMIYSLMFFIRLCTLMVISKGLPEQYS